MRVLLNRMARLEPLPDSLLVRPAAVEYSIWAGPCMTCMQHMDRNCEHAFAWNMAEKNSRA